MTLSVLLIALGAILCGCGPAGVPDSTHAQAAAAVSSAPSGEGTAATAQSDASAAPAGDPQLTPLADSDIQFYLDVMRAAAERVRHPTAQDMDALRRQKAFLDASSAAAQSNASQEAAVEAATAKAQAAIAAAMQSGDQSAIKAAAVQARMQLQAAGSAINPVTPPDPATMNLALNLGNGQADRQIVAERHLDAPRYERVASVIEEILVPPGTPMADCGGDCGEAPSAGELRREKAHQTGVARNRQLLLPYDAEIRSLQGVVRNGKT